MISSPKRNVFFETYSSNSKEEFNSQKQVNIKLIIDINFDGETAADNFIHWKDFPWEPPDYSWASHSR